MEAVEAYRALLALVQAQKNSSGSCNAATEVWHIVQIRVLCSLLRTTTVFKK
jgi:hypothetical protein